MRVLVTGGSGYIGSHTCVQLLQNGHDVIILDNLCNSKRSVLPVIERLGGKHPTFVEGDIRNEALMTEIDPGVCPVCWRAGGLHVSGNWR